METAKALESDPTILLVGNPNVGKSVLFGRLTGSYAHVANYAGTTVDIIRGTHRQRGVSVVDLPGTNSLLPDCDAERVTRDMLLDHLGQKGLEVIQVCDTKNLKRGLMLTIQLAELGVPMIMVANMQDEALQRGSSLDAPGLARLLGIEIFPAVAVKGEGLDLLSKGQVECRPSKFRTEYDPAVEEAVATLEPMLPAHLSGRRGLVLMILSGDRALRKRAEEWLGARMSEVDRLERDLALRLKEPVRMSLMRSRMAAVESLLSQVFKEPESVSLSSFVQRVGALATHRVWGLFTAFLVLYFMYLFVGVLGAGTMVDFLENTLFAGYLIPWVDQALRAVLPTGIETFMVGPAGTEIGTGPGMLIGDYGLVSMALSYSVAIILPIVGFFFIAFSFLEDSGYLPRMAVMLNRFFKMIGLNGNAVLPMILGLGCDTMATVTTRTLATRKERMITTLLLALAVPCSAQLGVTLGMLAALSWIATAVWFGVGIGVLLLVGFLASKTFSGKASDFIIEIPPLRRPKVSSIIVKTLARIEWYVKEAVPLFALGTFILWVFDRLNWLKLIEWASAPVVQHLLNLPEKATEAFLVGFLRRDYGAAGLYDLFGPALKAGSVSKEITIQVTVSMVTITLFIPCIANFFVMIKEQGAKVAGLMALFIVPFSFGVGALVNFVMRALWL